MGSPGQTCPKVSRCSSQNKLRLSGVTALNLKILGLVIQVAWSNLYF